jgi:hypothetical protein
MKNLNETRLRMYVRNLILEAYASNVDGPHLGNLMSPHLTQRDEIPYLGKKRNKEDEEIADHLMEPNVDMEDCYGPVPPTTEEPGVYTDPFSQDYHVIPNPAIPGRSR